MRRKRRSRGRMYTREDKWAVVFGFVDAVDVWLELSPCLLEGVGYSARGSNWHLHRKENPNSLI